MQERKRRVQELLGSESVLLQDAARRVYSALEILQEDRANMTATERAEQNRFLFAELADDNYSQSLLNPDHLHRVQPSGSAAVLTALLGVFQSARQDAVFGRARLVLRKADLLLALQDLLAADPADGEAVLSFWSSFELEHLPEQVEGEIKARVASGSANVFEQILKKANGTEFSWLYDYGCYIDPKELELAQFLFAYPEDQLEAMAGRIVSAFLHGFISQSRDRRGRQGVIFSYQVGQEALAQKVLQELEARGLYAVVSEPGTLLSSGRYALDHAFDQLLPACAQPAQWLETLEEALDIAAAAHKHRLLDLCGMVGIGQFGQPPAGMKKAEHAFTPTSAQMELFRRIAALRRSKEAEYLAPSDLSFCKVAFPNLHFAEQFPAVFADIFAMNLVESEPYERIQQLIIDALDRCAYVRVLGSAGNNTDLVVSLSALKNPERETNFLNCGGDLNIPHGEIFTTPVLQGTEGTWHVPEVYLRGRYFKDLTLVFAEGRITHYSCQNFLDPAKNREYIHRELLFPHDSLPMGEFAIGSNTRAYQIAKKHDLFPRLPILIAEKMGPHLAIGDPCFARGEEAPVYNLFDKKEMVARANEIAAQGGDVYTNKHIDITLPYDQIALLAGYTHAGEELAIIRDGRFVLAGTEPLNEPLDQLTEQGERMHE